MIWTMYRLVFENGRLPALFLLAENNVPRVLNVVAMKAISAYLSSNLLAAGRQRHGEKLIATN